MPHSFGLRARTRYLFARKFRTQGQLPLSTYLATYKVGDVVDIKGNGTIHKGLPHKFYQGLVIGASHQKRRAERGFFLLARADFRRWNSRERSEGKKSSERSESWKRRRKRPAELAFLSGLRSEFLPSFFSIALRDFFLQFAKPDSSFFCSRDRESSDSSFFV